MKPFKVDPEKNHRKQLKKAQKAIVQLVAKRTKALRKFDAREVWLSNKIDALTSHINAASANDFGKSAEKEAKKAIKRAKKGSVAAIK